MGLCCAGRGEGASDIRSDSDIRVSNVEDEDEGVDKDRLTRTRLPFHSDVQLLTWETM